MSEATGSGASAPASTSATTAATESNTPAQSPDTKGNRGSAASAAGANIPGESSQGEAIAATMGTPPLKAKPIPLKKLPGVLQEFQPPEDAEGPEPIEPPETEEAPAQKFKVGSEEFESEAAFVEQRRKEREQLKTLQGTYKATRALAEKAKAEIAKAQPHYERAVQWKQEAERLASENARLRQSPTAASAPSLAPQPAQPTQPQGFQPPPKLGEIDPTSDIDWDTYRSIESEHGTGVAAAWLVTETTKKVMQAVAESQEMFARPFQEQQRIQAILGKGEQMFQGLRSMKDDDGEPHYPELNDDDTSYAIAKLWLTQFGRVPEQELYSNPFYLHSAIEVWRGAQAHQDRYLKRHATPAEVAPVAEAVMGQSPSAPSAPDLGGSVSPPLARPRSRTGLSSQQYLKTGIMP